MSIDLAARAAVKVWPTADAIIAVAIAGPESGYNAQARGDHYSIFPPDQQAVYLQYACDGYTSFGLWQINTRWHYPELSALTGQVDPCLWAAWLFDPDNNARLARSIFDSQGWEAWTAYNTGAYVAYYPQAALAVARALVTTAGLPPVVPVEPPLLAVAPPIEAVIPPTEPVSPAGS